MTEIATIGLPNGGASTIGRVTGVAVQPSRSLPRDDSAGVRRGEDRVEVSQLATYLSKLNQLPSIRHELVSSVREQLAAGTYDVDGKLDEAIGELFKDL